MASITPGISKGQMVALSFAQDNVAASQTDAQLYVMEVASAAALVVDEVYMPFNGEVVAVGYDLSAAGSAGTLTIGATINGTEDADSTVTVTTAQRGVKKIERGKCPFVAGQYLGAEITTDGSWNGTSSDLLVTLWVIVYAEGI